MAGGKEGPKGPLGAAYEHSKYDIGVSFRRNRERRILVERFETAARDMLRVWGAPSESDPNQILTPEATIVTGRGDVILHVFGEKDNETGFFKRVSLEARYGEFELPFVPPEKPIKPSSVGVDYDSTGELKTSRYDLSKSKKLRKAIDVLLVLEDSYVASKKEPLPLQ